MYKEDKEKIWTEKRETGKLRKPPKLQLIMHVIIIKLIIEDQLIINKMC